MTRIAPIVRREFLERVRTKAFIIGTLAGPVILSGMMLVPALMAERVGKPLALAVLDLGGEVGPVVEAALKRAENAGRKRFEIHAPGGDGLAVPCLLDFDPDSGVEGDHGRG